MRNSLGKETAYASRMEERYPEHARLTVRITRQARPTNLLIRGLARYPASQGSSKRYRYDSKVKFQSDHAVEIIL